MIYPEPMQRVAIVAPKSHVKDLIETLYKHGVLHLIDHTKEKLDIGSPLPGSAILADLLVKARSLIHSLEIKPDNTPATSVVGDLQAQINSINDEVTALFAGKKELSDALSKVISDHKNYSELQWLHIDTKKLRESKHLSYFLGTLKIPEGFHHAISKITTNFYLETQKNGAGIFLLIEANSANAARAILTERGFLPADHQKLIALDVSLDKKIKELDSESHNLQKEIHKVDSQLAKVARENGSFLVEAERLLSVDAKKAQTPLRFGVTKNAVFVNGWVPQSHSEALARELDTKLGEEVAVHKIHTHHDAPIKLNNNFAVSPFEALLRLYTLPKYHEIDPSTLLFLSFPIFFGFMLGDIGYGLVLLILFMVMRAVYRNNKEVAALSSILIMSSVATIIFGIVFGEFFGLEEIGHFHLPYLIHRAHDMITLLYVALAIGVIHITVALVVGFINELHHTHNFFKAFCAKISWLVFLIALGLITAGFMINPTLKYFGYGLLVLSIVLIYLGEGVRGLVELPGILSNIMSYARLMAIGVASAALAIVVNELATKVIHTGTIAGIIGGILILVLGHLINLILGIIGPFLHSLRLHYVEFFSKFYEGGGKPYKPFGADEG